MHSILETFCDELISRVKKDVDDIEIRATISKSDTFEIINKQINPDIVNNKITVGIRVLYDSKLSSVATMSLDIDENVRAVKKALEFSVPTQRLHFSNQIRSNKNIKTFSQDLSAFCTTENLYKLAGQIQNICYNNSTKNIESLEAAIIYAEETKSISTKNAKNSFLQNSFYSYIDLNAQVRNSFYANQMISEKDFLEFSKTTAASLKDTISTINFIDKQYVDVILAPDVFSNIVRTLGLEKFKAVNTISGINKLNINEIIFPSFFCISDDPTAPYYWATSPFDDEGTDTIKKELVKNGSLKDFLVSTQSELSSNYKANGSAYRVPVTAEMTHEAPLSESFSNLIVEHGTVLSSDLIKNTKQGFLITGLLGLHTANKASTEFSCGIMSGFYIENGIIKGNLASGSWNISGTLFSYGNRNSFIERSELSSDRKFIGDGLFPYIKTKLEYNS